MGKSSLWTSFNRVIKALCTIAPNIIKWPDARRRTVSSAHFETIGRMKGVIGAVDGTYCQIKAPTVKPEVYINRKCFYGITLQAIADFELKFINCFAGYPSSVSDTRIFKNSPIYQKMKNSYLNCFDVGQYILGDKAYPCMKFIIPPYIERGNVTDKELVFNQYQAQTRQVVERSFALLFGRFRRLKDLDMNRTDLIPYTIVACCVLHNLCLDDDDLDGEYERDGREFLEHRDQNLVAEESSEVNDMPLDDLPHEAVGLLLRDEIRDYLPATHLSHRRHRRRIYS